MGLIFVKSLVLTKHHCWPQKYDAEQVDGRMSISEYIENCVVWTLVSADFLIGCRETPRLCTWPSCSVADSCCLSCVRLDKYLVRHGDVVQLGSSTDDVFSLSDPVVSVQPDNGLWQQPASIRRHLQCKQICEWSTRSGRMRHTLWGHFTRQLNFETY